MVAAYDASSSLYHQWQRADGRLQIEVRPEGRLADQFRWPVKGQATWADGVRVWTQRLSSNGRELIAESLPVFGRDCAVSLELVDAGGATWKGDVQLTAVGAGVARVVQGGPVEQCWVQILGMESNRPLAGARVRARRVGPASGNAPFAVVDEEGVASVGEASGVLGIEVLLGHSGIASRQGLQEGT